LRRRQLYSSYAPGFTGMGRAHSLLAAHRLQCPRRQGQRQGPQALSGDHIPPHSPLAALCGPRRRSRPTPAGNIVEYFVIRGEREPIVFLPQRRGFLPLLDLRARFSRRLTSPPGRGYSSTMDWGANSMSGEGIQPARKKQILILKKGEIRVKLRSEVIMRDRAEK